MKMNHIDLMLFHKLPDITDGVRYRHTAVIPVTGLQPLQDLPSRSAIKHLHMIVLHAASSIITDNLIDFVAPCLHSIIYLTDHLLRAPAGICGI